MLSWSYFNKEFKTCSPLYHEMASISCQPMEKIAQGVNREGGGFIQH